MPQYYKYECVALLSKYSVTIIYVCKRVLYTRAYLVVPVSKDPLFFTHFEMAAKTTGSFCSIELRAGAVYGKP